MPATFICVDVIVDGKKVGGDNGMFMTFDDTAKKELAIGFSVPFSRIRGLGMQTLFYLMVPMLLFFDV